MQLQEHHSTLEQGIHLRRESVGKTKGYDIPFFPPSGSGSWAFHGSGTGWLDEAS